MNQLGSITNYVGRTVDLLAFQGQQLSGDQLLTQSLAESGLGGEICTGIQKLVQRWLIEFLTITGTLQYLPARGCDFMALVRQGQLATTIDVQQGFYLSAQQVQTNLLGEQSAATPLDESFSSATLNTIILGGDKLTIYVTILSQAGKSAQAILPITVNN